MFYDEQCLSLFFFRSCLVTLVGREVSFEIQVLVPREMRGMNQLSGGTHQREELGNHDKQITVFWGL